MPNHLRHSLIHSVLLDHLMKSEIQQLRPVLRKKTHFAVIILLRSILSEAQHLPLLIYQQSSAAVRSCTVSEKKPSYFPCTLNPYTKDADFVLLKICLQLFIIVTLHTMILTWVKKIIEIGRASC